MVGESACAEGAAFAQALSALKKRGSNLLVVGAGLNGCHRAACNRLFGDATARPRRRLQVRIDGECGVRRLDGLDAELVALGRPGKRSTVAETGTSVRVPRYRTVTTDPDELRTAVIEEIDRIDTETGGLSPAELRVCFDSLAPLVLESDAEYRSRMIEPVTDHVRAHDGMGHFHLPVAADDDAVAALEPSFDAIITVRTRDGTTEHCWRLVEDDVSSGWLPL